MRSENVSLEPRIDWPALLDQARALDARAIPLEQHLEIASRPAISMWAKAIGSRNRMYLDEAYAREGVYGCLLAPGVFLHAIANAAAVPGLPQLGTLLCGVNWRFDAPLRVGEHVVATATVVGSELKDTSFAGAAIMQTIETLYRGEDGRAYGSARAQCLRYDRAAAVRNRHYSGHQRHHYTRNELDDIASAYMTEAIRGDDSIYLDDLAVGDSVGQIVRGPLNADDVIQFIERTAPRLTYERFLHARLADPYLAYTDAYGTPQSYDASMLLDEVAQRIGLPIAHDSGMQRVAWLEDLVRNWAGDWSQISDLSVRLLRPNYATYTTWCAGTIVSVAKPTDPRPDIHLQLACTNQLGEVTAEATAVVRVPSRRLAHELLVR